MPHLRPTAAAFIRSTLMEIVRMPLTERSGLDQDSWCGVRYNTPLPEICLYQGDKKLCQNLKMMEGGDAGRSPFCAVVDSHMPVCNGCNQSSTRQPVQSRRTMRWSCSLRNVQHGIVAFLCSKNVGAKSNHVIHPRESTEILKDKPALPSVGCAS